MEQAFGQNEFSPIPCISPVCNFENHQLGRVRGGKSNFNNQNKYKLLSNKSNTNLLATYQIKICNSIGTENQYTKFYKNNTLLLQMIIICSTINEISFTLLLN